jgi:hypothetical protein
MKLSKFFTLIISITCISLLYVYQQSEIFRLAYVGQKQQAFLEELLAKNSILHYNIERRASLVHLAKSFSAGTDYEMPESYRLVKMPLSKEGLALAGRGKKETLLSRIFSIKRQAEARTINP